MVVVAVAVAGKIDKKRPGNEERERHHRSNRNITSILNLV